MRMRSAILCVMMLMVLTSFPFGIVREAAAGEEPAAPRFKWGFAERIRQAYILNGIDLENDTDDDRNYIRVRSQLWASLRPSEGIELYAMLNNEHRHWMKPDTDFDIDELIFENLYLRLDRIGGSPVSVIVGRQNIMLGEGFILLDGGPLDGSRTAYLNAFRMIVEDEERSFELHVISDPHRDEYFPRINSKQKPLIEWDETGAGLYFTEKKLSRLRFEGYYEFKREKQEDDLLLETKLHTFGVRVSGSPYERLGIAGELAVQRGERGDGDRRGAGGYFHATYAVPAPLEPKFTAGAIYLSGDDPKTADYEGWDPLYGRWPKWSELYIYTLIRETGVAYWTNMFAPYLGVTLKPHERLELIARGYLVSTPEEAPQVWDAGLEEWRFLAMFGDGQRRGTLMTAQLKWSFTEYLSGHLLWERFDPGSYYHDGADTAHFLRWEIYFKY
ncbi:MAG TPA: alginate export family protein [Patescibacteria group bacterium]|nr:alginate export family protein [Patescibacteria group bacterium]